MTKQFWLSVLDTCFHLTTTVFNHYDDVIMTMLASQITSLTVVYSIVYSGVNQRKHQSSASLAFVREIHRGPVNFPHKWPVTRKMFPFDDVIMSCKSCACAKTARQYLMVIPIMSPPFVPLQPGNSYFWSGFNRLAWCEEHFTKKPLPQALSRFRVKFDEFYSGRSFPIVNYFTWLYWMKSDEIYWNTWEFSSQTLEGHSICLPIWAASACRAMPHPLRWQHNSNLVFWSHAFTPIQQCSIIQIMCRCTNDKVNPYHVMWLVRVVFFEDCQAFLIDIFTLSLNKKKTSHVWTVALATSPFSSTFMNC